MKPPTPREPWWSLQRKMLSSLLSLTVLGTIVVYLLAYRLASEHDVSLAEVHFERPWLAWLLLAIPLTLLHRSSRFDLRGPRLQTSQGVLLSRSAAHGRQLPRGGLRLGLRSLLPALRGTALALMVLALMGPRSVRARRTSDVDGIDIVLTLDMSLSMEATDIQPSRFRATQAVVDDFIAEREQDRIGAVVFGEEAFTLLPLTTDKTVLRNTITELQLRSIGGQGTAIGNAVATSLNRLRRSEAKSRVIILLTDGDSNSGNLSPEQAADFAKALDVRIYTVLMGQSDEAPVRQGVDLFRNPIMAMGQFPVNPELLRAMAEATGGKFFSVADRRGLEESFHAILDSLEKSQIENRGVVYGELFFVFLFPAIWLLAIEWLAGTLWLRRWP